MKLRDFPLRFERDAAEIVVLDETIARCGEYAEFFYSFFVLDGMLHSVNVRYHVLSQYQGLEVIWPYDRILLNRYESADGRIELVDRVDLGPGGDPRAVSNGNDAFVVIVGDLVGDEPDALLYDVRRQRLLPIQFSDPEFHWGKNWQPFMDGDELCVVHALAPFRVMRIDVKSGAASEVRVVDTSFNLPCCYYGGDPYSLLRGGSNAILQGSTILGTGHATSTGYRHAPFLWSMEADGQLEITFTDFFSDFFACGFNLIDPTSLFIDGSDTYLGLCCTERDWMHNQRITNLLIAFRGSGTIGVFPTLKEFLTERIAVTKRDRARLHESLFLCIEMPSATDYIQEHNGKVSTGKPGQLVCGPYVPIKCEGRYRAELNYLTRSCRDDRAGEFDVTLSRTGDDGTVESRTLASVELVDSGGNTREAKIEFDTTGFIGWTLETRVFVDANITMNAFHIRTHALNS